MCLLNNIKSAINNVRPRTDRLLIIGAVIHSYFDFMQSFLLSSSPGLWVRVFHYHCIYQSLE